VGDVTFGVVLEFLVYAIGDRAQSQ